MSEQYLGVGGRMVTVGGKAVKMPQGVGGRDGVTFTPAMNAAGDLSWTNDGGLENPKTVNLMGPQGPQGPQGSQGPKGADGAKGAKGADGAPGKDGVTFTPAVSAAGILSWSNDGGLVNPASVNIKGQKGADGAPGKDGAKGDKGDPGDPGEQGPQGLKGDTGEQGPQGPAGTANVPKTTAILKGNGSGGVVAATRGSDYIASGNITKQTLVATKTTPTENNAINWYYS